jgi:transposase-like protein
MISLAEMYVQGVSIRKVAAITERFCGALVSSTHLSRAAALLDEVLEARRERWRNIFGQPPNSRPGWRKAFRRA